MALPQASPEEGRNRHVHFRYVPTQNGTTWHAWLAGVPHWYLCHTLKRTKPCLHAMTGGKVSCPRCGESAEPEVIGYVPVYREVDACPVMVIIHLEQQERAEQLAIHQRILIGREAQKADGVWLSPALRPTPTFQTTLEVRRKPADLTETLLRLWNLPDLTAWYRSLELVPDQVPDQAKPRRESLPVDKARADQVNRNFAHAVVEARKRGNPPLGEAAELAAVLPAVGLNGTHKPKKV